MCLCHESMRVKGFLNYVLTFYVEKILMQGCRDLRFDGIMCGVFRIEWIHYDVPPACQE